MASIDQELDNKASHLSLMERKIKYHQDSHLNCYKKYVYKKESALILQIFLKIPIIFQLPLQLRSY